MNENYFRNRITIITFILSILVIWTHAYNAELFMGAGAGAMAVYVEKIVAEKLGQIAVPGFFMISSYLFFRGLDIKNLPAKWLRRVKSILIPYMLWNLIYYAGYIIASRIPVLTDIVGKGEVPISFNTLKEAVLFYRYNPVFWYIFQLIVLIALSPVIYLLLKKIYIAIPVLIAIAVIIHLGINFPIINEDAVWYYMVAAYMAMHHSRKVEQNGGIIEAFLGLMCIIAAMCAYDLAGMMGYVPLIVLCRTLAPIGVWCVLSVLKVKYAASYMQNSFLVYAMHFAMVRLINKSLAYILPNIEYVAIAVYLIMPFVIIAIICWISGLCRHRAPLVHKVLSGGR